ncbi:phosphoribosylamine--glycine ligase [Ruminococcaceae bacterium OttesenSCG-928-A16]|nr:phosphoribosylamine--glycine ligase [Ruminococcaceae bacterium OttesenSCG-928-A16]
MKIAVVGSGGREHALVKKLAQSPLCGEIIVLPGNAGMVGDALIAPMNAKATDLEAIVAYCKQAGVQYVVVAPDDPLALGMVDALAAEGIPAFGPNKAAARIEASKVFSKNLMQKYNIPTAAYQSFTSYAEAKAYVQRHTTYPLVVKADGLALGKGVIICQDEKEALAAVQSMLQDGAFGAAGNSVVIEEFLTGPEVSVLAFCDGETLVPMVSSMDHKRVNDDDEGPNTGGMGAVAPNPFYTPQMAAQCMEEIFMPTVKAMQAEGCPFKGCLYFGLMLTPAGPKVIEYNCRFGDPETQVVLPLLQSDLLAVMMACTDETLTPEMVEFSSGAAACVVLASGGYPGPYQTGYPITGLEATEVVADNVNVYFAGVAAGENGELVTGGGRVLGVSATGSTLRGALTAAYLAAGQIKFAGKHTRMDIGRRALQKIEK